MACDKNDSTLKDMPTHQHNSILTGFHDKHDSTLHSLVSSLNSKEYPHLWHMRLGHPSNTLLTNFLRLYNLHIKHVHAECVAYAIGKSKRQSHSSPNTQYFAPLELVSRC